MIGTIFFFFFLFFLLHCNPTWDLVFTRSFQDFYFDDLSPISQFNFFKSHLHLFLCCPLVLIPIWLRLVSLLTSFISYIQLRCPQRCILCAFIFSVYQLLQSLNIIYSPSFLFSCNDTCTIILQWPSHLFRV